MSIEIKEAMGTGVTPELTAHNPHEPAVFAVDADFRSYISRLNGGIDLASPFDTHFNYYYDRTVLNEEDALRLLEDEALEGHQPHPFGDIYEELGPDNEKTQLPIHDTGPLADISRVRQQAVTLFRRHSAQAIARPDNKAVQEHIGTEQATFEQEARKILVDVFNSIGERDVQTRIQLGGKDMRGINMGILVTRQLVSWRSRLSMHRRQNDSAALFEAADDLDPQTIRTPSLADRYLLSYFSSKARFEDDTYPESLRGKKIYDDLEPQAVARLDELFASGSAGYMAIADIFYGGSMKKAFVNLSFISKMARQPMPSDWQAFPDSTIEFAAALNLLTELRVQSDQVSYVKVADEHFAGSMSKAYTCLSAAAKMTGQPMPGDWRKFQGSTAEFNNFKNLLPAIQQKTGVGGYVEIADEYFGGDMNKAITSLSAVAVMTGQAIPSGWQGFQGSTAEFHDQACFVRDNIKLTDKEQIYGMYRAKYHSKEKPRRFVSELNSRMNFLAIWNMCSESFEQPA